MNFIKRGFVGIMRRKGKSLILLAVLFILGNLIAGAISIQQATNNVEYNIRERLGATIVIERDYQTIEALSDEEMVNLESEDISVESIRQVGELPYVKYYDYYTHFGLGSKSLKYYFGQDVDQAAAEETKIDFGMKGINYPNVLDFENGDGNLIDGRVFSQDEIDNGSPVTLISEKLAEINNLHVGDTIVLNNDVYSYDLDTYEEELFSSRDLVLEVIGIFEIVAVKDDIEFDFGQGTINWEDTLVQNTIYVPNQVIFNEMDFDWEETKKAIPEFADTMTENPQIGSYRTMYVLESHEYIDAFKQEADPLLPPYYHVVSSGDHYDTISGPVESMSTLSRYVFMAAIFATILIAGLVVLLFLRDRKHELGIYLSLGEKRGRVIGQILIEVMVVAFVGVTLSLFSGNFIASQVSQTLIKTDETADFEQVDYINKDLTSDLTVDDVIGLYEVKLNTNYILVFYSVGLATILISTLLPLIYIVRLNPKQILM